MAKRVLIAAGLVGIIGLVGMSFSGLAQQSPEKPTSTVLKPVSANLSLCLWSPNPRGLPLKTKPKP